MITNVDWEAVKAYYLETRSYKQTAEKFCLNLSTVRNRAQRQGWGKNEYPPDTQTGQDEYSPDTQTGQDEYSPDTQTGQDEYSPDTQTGQDEYSPDTQTGQDEYSPDTQTGQDEYSPDTHFPELPCIANLTARDVELKHPWDAAVVDHDKLADKSAYRAYITNPRTQDCLFSGVLGEAFNLRVGRDNKPAKLLAMVADYDTAFPEDKVMKMLDKLPTRPNFISRSYSGGTHAVWILERPIPLPPDEEAQDKLLSIIRKELKLNTAFGPLDTNAFCNLGQYYHAGWDWRCTNTEPVSTARTMLWVVDAAKKASKGNVPAVPMSVVAAEVERRFPGRWQGDFTVGARGVRFWDESADNPTAAIVTENGMLCFTGAVPFIGWEAIFGSGFVEKYREDTLGRVLAECYFVNNTFYVKGRTFGSEAWQCYNRQSMESLLSSRYGLRNRAGKDEDQSEVKAAIAAIIDQNALPSARPFIYRTDTIVPFDGQPVLNTSLLRVHPPEAGKGESWGDGFPWTAAFLERLFPDIIQRERFMCEWAYAYKHAYAGKPRNGRVVFIAGETGVGKNFITEQLIGPSLGGFTDPSDYLLGRTRFTDDLFSKGVWVCNDTVARGEEKERRIFTSNLKRMAANARHVWEGKYKGATGIDWCGRVYITINTDPVSLQLLPELDQSNSDKISLYRTGGAELNDPGAVDAVKRELGALCAYLLNLEYPEHCVDKERWGVKGYKHDFLKDTAKATGAAASFAEVLERFCQNMFSGDTQLEKLDGTSAWYLERMSEAEGFKTLIKGFDNVITFGRAMGSLVSTKTFPVALHKTCTSNRWVIGRTEFDEYQKYGAKEDTDDENVPF